MQKGIGNNRSKTSTQRRKGSAECGVQSAERQRQNAKAQGRKDARKTQYIGACLHLSVGHRAPHIATPPSKTSTQRRKGAKTQRKPSALGLATSFQLDTAIKNINAKTQGREDARKTQDIGACRHVLVGPCACRIAPKPVLYTGTPHHCRCDLPLNVIKPRAAATFLPTFFVVTKSRTP